MSFEERLQRAVERGSRTAAARDQAQSERTWTEEEFRNLHSRYRLELSEHIEECLRKMPDHFPGFRYSGVMSSDGWGAVITRDDVGQAPGGKVQNFYSRLELLVRPYSAVHVLDLSGKGTIRNKEVFHRSQFQRLQEANLDTFRELIDAWIVDYAEVYAAQK